MATGLDATQLASLIKATTTGGKHFPAVDEAPAVALGLYYTHNNKLDQTGQFGWPVDANSGAGLLLTSCLNEQANGRDYFSNPKLPGGWQLFLPEATAALTTTPAGPDNTYGTNPIQNSPAQQYINDTSLGGLISRTNKALFSLEDPLFWRQVWFIFGGWALISIGTFQIIRGGLIRPVGEGLRQADNFAYDVANLRNNVVKPYKRYRAQRKATAGARATARGNKLMGLAPGARRHNQKHPLGDTKFQLTQPTPRPTATPGAKPPPAKFTNP